MHPMTKPISVALLRREDYDAPGLRRDVETLFQTVGFAPRAGDRVLVKPNLVYVRQGPLSCTDARVVRAACEVLLDYGAKLTVGDSPAFGTAAGVARKCGLLQHMRELGLAVQGLNSPRPVPLSFGGTIGVSSQALESDHVLNIPRLKAHNQVRLTGGVKNLFGCVAGMRKSLAHTRFGEMDNRFESMLLEVGLALPPVTTLMDGVEAMHVRGPLGGQAYGLGLLGCSASPVAMDTAAFSLLPVEPDQVPTWREARARKLPGAFARDLVFPLQNLEAFDGSGFQVPQQLSRVNFPLVRLIRGSFKRVWRRLR